jgi:hypothetical protein
VNLRQASPDGDPHDRDLSPTVPVLPPDALQISGGCTWVKI